MELTSFKLNGIYLQLTNDNIDENLNKFTLLLGENGSGKSEAIREIINILLRMKINNSRNEKHNDQLDNYLENRYKSTLRDKNISALAEFKFNRNVISASFNKTNEDRTIINFKGEKETLKESAYRYNFNVESNISNEQFTEFLKSVNIVAVSESPYIKFPIIQSNDVLDYFYIGKKDEKEKQYEYMDSRSDDYSDPKIEQLAKSIFKIMADSEKFNIVDVLDYLSFSQNFAIHVKLKSQYYQRVNDINNLIDSIFNASSKFSSLGMKNDNADTEQDRKCLEKAINYIKDNLNSNSKSSFESTFNSNSHIINFNIKKRNEVSKHIHILLKYKIINITKLIFHKKEHEIDAVQLSSGQLCILSNILGIASRITDNSFIFIDEPEISLHPSWQSSFIQLLEKSFSNYQKCHFIIATHSPHIISSINKKTSHVVVMGQDESATPYGRYACQGWTVDEILQDVMGMDETRSELYNTLIKSFNDALDEDDAILAKALFGKLSEIIHPENVLKNILEIQMIGVGDND